MANKALVNGIHMHFQQRGEGEDVILLHGITSSLAMWYNGIYPALSAQYRTTAYDMRGHGLTDITENGYSSYDMAGDLLALMDHLGIAKARLVGHSFGGAIALHASLLRPERVAGVVMLDSGLACLRYLRIIQEWMGWNNRPADLMQNGLTLEQFLELDSKQDVTEVIRHGLTVPRRAGFRKGQNAMTPRLQKLIETRMGYEFRDVAGMTEELLTGHGTPVLALYGETSPYQKMAAHLSQILPNCRHEVLPGAGHFYAVHRPGLLLERISGFLVNPLEYVHANPARDYPEGNTDNALEQPQPAIPPSV